MPEEGTVVVSEAPQKSSKRLRILPAVLGAGLAGVLLAFVAAGCSSGQDVQTEVEPAVNGTNGQVGPIAIRNAQFAYPEHGNGNYGAGSEATLIVAIVNTSSSEDALVDVTSPVAEEPATITGDRNLPPRRALLVGMSEEGFMLPSSSAAPTSRPTTSVSGTASQTTSTQPTAEPIEFGKATIAFERLANPVTAGKTYPVTFVFRNAGSITVDIPIATPTTARVETTGESHG
jgi:copper(I)-binding protein